LLSRKDPYAKRTPRAVSTWTRGVIAFDLATKLTDGDGDTAMDEEESLAQHGFADYTLAPREGFWPDGYCGRPRKRLAV
jgi:hypothetical protein